MKRILVLAMALIMALSCVSFASAENDVVTITYFGNNAMAGSGELTGTLGKFFNDRGLNIEVVPYNTEKLQAQLASGDLADVIFLGQQEMRVAAESGLILPLDDYLEKMPNLMKHIDLFEASFNFAREYKSNGTGKLYATACRILDKYLLNKQKDLIRIIEKNSSFSPMTPFDHTRTLTKGYIGLGAKMGEGWLLTAEMLELIEQGVNNIVCTQPFGCLPNHIMGKGMMKPIKENHPGVNIVAIDYDPGATKINQENRIKLLLANANREV